MSYEAGSGIVFKEIDGKTLICVERATSLELKEGNFTLKGDSLEIRAGHGIKISSVHPNILVLSVDTSKQDERIFDLQKEIDARLKNIEAIFVKIVKQAKT